MDSPAVGGLAVRRATPSDLEILVEITGAEAPQIGTQAIRAAVTRSLEEDLVLVAMRSGAIIGCIMGQHRPHVVIHALCVLAHERRRGCATKLIGEAVGEAGFGAGSLSFWTAVDPSRNNASSGFLDNGFRTIAAEEVPNWPHGDLVLMRRP